MSSQVSPPVTGGQGIGMPCPFRMGNDGRGTPAACIAHVSTCEQCLADIAIGSSTQPTTALPQTSAQETALPANGQAGSSKPLEGAVGSTGDATLGAPGQGSSAAPAGGDSAQRISENVERSSKRSLTGRRREGSMSSKRSARQVAGANEKATRPGSASRSNVAPTKKKKKGLLSFLNCCSAPDEAQELGATDSAQPAKTPAARSQATRAKPPQQASQAPTASATNTSTQDSKEIIDEKSAPQANHNMPAAAPILPSPLATDAEKPQQVVQPENPVPSIPPGTTSIQPNPETSPLQAERGGLEPEDPTTGPPHLDTSSKALETPAGAGASPQVNVIQPTPVVPHHQDEDGSAMILDRTPEQAELDTQIENTDNNPSLPLSTADVPAAAEGEQKERERRESEGSSRIGLPPPPPLAERQAQVNAPAVAGGLFAADATAQQQQSHENSVVSTPEPVQKWLLPPIKPEMKGRKCLVLDLDETLVHSSFKVCDV